MGAAIFACAMFLMGLITPLAGEIDTAKETPVLEGTRAPRGPILIDGNSDFTGSNGVSNPAAAGSSIDPFIIQNFEIDGGGTGVCIDIRNTDAYFEIKNCELSNAGQGVSLRFVLNFEITNCDIFDNNAGIYLQESHNGEIDINDIHDNTDGIKLYNENTGNLIDNNQIYRNSNFGVTLNFYSNWNNITNNNISYNFDSGVYLHALSNNNRVESNYFYHNNYSSINTRESNNNQFLDNDCHYSDSYGIYMGYSVQNEVTDNRFYNNNLSGVKMFLTNDTVFDNNEFINNGITIYGIELKSWNTHDIDTTNTVNGKPLRYIKDTNGGTIPMDTGQVILANCTGFTVDGLNLQRSSCGVILGFTSGSTVNNINSSDNGEWGIYLQESDHNNLTNLEVYNIIDQGVYLIYSEYNKIDRVEASFMDIGIQLKHSDLNTVSNCTVGSNDVGIYVWKSDKNLIYKNRGPNNSNSTIFLENAINNTISFNNASGNVIKGIGMLGANWNTIFGNYVGGNGENGIYSFNCDWNYVAHNTITDHPRQGILFEFGSDNNFIHYNDVFDNDFSGIHFQLSSQISNIQYNRVWNSGEHGIFIDGHGANWNTVNHNLVWDNAQYGIYLLGPDESGINYNHAWNNDVGIFAGYCFKGNIKFNVAHHNTDSGIKIDQISNSNNVFQNTVYNNNYGIYVASSEGNRISLNNLYDNTQAKQAYDASGTNNWNKSTVGNFWQGWTSPDADNDYIVDDPYEISTTPVVKDHYPLAIRSRQIVIVTNDDPDAYEDKMYSTEYELLEINSPPTDAKWKLNTNATWINLTSDGEMWGTPHMKDIGWYWVNLTCFDPHDAANFDFHNFTMTVNDVDIPPTIQTLNDADATEDSPYYRDYDAYDPDPFTTLRWYVKTSARFLTMNEMTGELNGTPSDEDVGAHFTVVWVSDGTNNVSTNFSLRVKNINDQPEIITTPPTEVMERAPFQFQFAAIDPDPGNETFQWGLESDGDFMWIGMLDGMFEGLPKEDDIGSYWVKITVLDGQGGLDIINFTLKVIPNTNFVNQAPKTRMELADFSFDEDTEDGRIVLPDWFEDPDWDTMKFRYEPNDNISIWIKPNGQVILTPKTNWSGTETITFWANDSVLESSASVNVSVVPVNDHPAEAQIILEEQPYYEGEPQPATANATDGDLEYGDSLTFSWTIDTKGSMGEEQTIDLGLAAGVHIVYLRITDSQGAWIEISRKIEVLKKNDTNITDDDIVPDDDDDDDDEKKGFLESWWWLLLIILIVLIILVVVVIIVMKSKKKKEPEPLPPEMTFTVGEDEKESYPDYTETDLYGAAPAAGPAPAQPMPPAQEEEQLPETVQQEALPPGDIGFDAPEDPAEEPMGEPVAEEPEGSVEEPAGMPDLDEVPEESEEDSANYDDLDNLFE